MTGSDLWPAWAVVAVPFPYTDRLAEKRRPALVVSKPDLQRRHGLVWVAMITSAGNARWPQDVLLPDHAAAGLPAPSVVRPTKVAVIDASRIVRRLGALPAGLRPDVAARLRAVLA